MTERCTGHCCKCFVLPYPPTELKERVAKGEITDGKQVVEMVEYIGAFASNPQAKTTAVQEGEAHFYTCKNLKPNGDCGIYETRPATCRKYPYGRPCEFVGCSLSAGGQQLQQSKLVQIESGGKEEDDG